MANFGEILRKYREKTFEPKLGKRLSQSRLADLLSLEVGFSLTYGSVSNWERGVNQVSKDDRRILVGLIKVLYEYKGITQLEEADQLLWAGNYRELNQQERQYITPDWTGDSNRHISNEQALSFQYAQELLLPPKDYTELFGVEKHFIDILAVLVRPEPPWIVSIVGLGGIGKTTLARMVAERCIVQKDFDHVIWLSFNTSFGVQKPADLNYEALLTILSKHILTKRPEVYSHELQEMEFAQVHKYLKQNRCLIVIDSLDSKAQNEQFLTELHRLTLPTKILYTARYYPQQRLPIYVHTLDELPIPAALNILRHYAEIAGANEFSNLKDEELVEFFEITGGHPLALRLISNLARFHSVKNLKSGWQKRSTKQIDLLYKDIYDKYWKLFSHEEKHLMNTMVLVSREGASEEHLLATSGLSTEQFGTALENLLKVSLILPLGTVYTKRYGIHSLTEQYLESLRQNIEKAEYRLLEVHIKKCVAFNVSYWGKRLTEEAPHWRTIDAEKHNIFRAVELATRGSAEDIESYQIPLISLIDTFTDFVEQRGYWQEWLLVIEKILENPQISNPLLRGHFYRQLGKLYRLARRLSQAIQAHQTVVHIATKLENSLELAHAHVQLGLDYRRNREYEKAEHYGLSALEVFSQHGLIGRERATVLNLLGLTARAKGEFEKAKIHLLEAIEIWRANDFPVELVRSLNNLGAVLQSQKKDDEALVYYQEAKEVLLRTTSESDWILVTLSEGAAHFNLGQLQEAKAALKSIDTDFLEKSDDAFNQTLLFHYLGKIAMEDQQFEQAENYLQRSVTGWRQTGNDIRLADALGSLGRSLISQQRAHEAIEIFGEAVALLEKYPQDMYASLLLSRLLSEKQSLDTFITKIIK